MAASQDAETAAALEALELLAEPRRRRVFDLLQARGPLTVSELVEELAMGRTLVAFHVGKLVDAGFLEAVPAEAAPGRVGRPAQRYRLTGRELSVSVPARRYDLLAGVLLDVLAEHRPGERAQRTAERVARRRGAELAEQVRPRGRSALGRLERLLTALGYAPRRQAATLQVLNCPFDRFREGSTAQVCPLNLGLSEGYLQGLGVEEDVRAELTPCPTTCCITFTAR